METIIKGYVNIGEGQIHYRTNAPHSEKPALVLLHQTPSSSVMFEALMAELAEHFWLIAPDTPGFGNSFQPDKVVSIPFLAQSLYQALIELGLTQCYLFGHHTGASIALQLAFEQPNFVSKLALSGPPLLTEAQKQLLKKKLPDKRLPADGSHLLKAWQGIAGKDDNASLELIQRETLLSLQLGAQFYHQTYQAVFEHDFGGQLQEIICPTLVLAGENDSLVSSLEPSFKLLQNGQKELVSQAGAYICDTHPEITANILRKFYLSNQSDEVQQ